MKCLINRFYILFLIFFSFIYSYECLSKWNESFINNSINKIVYIEAIGKTYGDSLFNDTENFESIYKIELYLYNDKKIIRINYKDQIFIFDPYKSIKYFENTNQRFISNPDSFFLELLLLLFNGQLSNHTEKNLENEYYLKLVNPNQFNQSKKIFFIIDDLCQNLDKINFQMLNDNTITMEEISINYLDSKNFHEIFEFNKDYFDYDIRK